VPQSAIKYQTVVSQMFAENAYLVHLDGRQECLVIDPGLDWDEIIERLESQQLQPVAILNTHGHADHIAGNEALKRRWPDCPLIIGRGDEAKLTDPMQNLSGQFGIAMTSPPADRLVDGGEHLELGGIEFTVLAVPGHCEGHVAFLWKGGTPWVVFGGDVLFRDGIGRTDFPDGNFQKLATSIRTQLFTLPPETIVLPGHGDPTTVGYEQQHNPFVGRRSQ
jgi:hydroxyacylglutathione hydrolase